MDTGNVTIESFKFCDLFDRIVVNISIPKSIKLFKCQSFVRRIDLVSGDMGSQCLAREAFGIITLALSRLTGLLYCLFRMDFAGWLILCQVMVFLCRT